jgi:hypothetical protein
MEGLAQAITTLPPDAVDRQRLLECLGNAEKNRANGKVKEAAKWVMQVGAALHKKGGDALPLAVRRVVAPHSRGCHSAPGCKIGVTWSVLCVIIFMCYCPDALLRLHSLRGQMVTSTVYWLSSLNVFLTK